MKVLAVIPARYASTRFPGKPLALLGGKAVIDYAYGVAIAASCVHRAVVATDDSRIYDHMVEHFGEASVLMTSAEHRSGTDRCGEVVRRLKERDEEYDVVVNLQGDEPFVRAQQLGSLVDCFHNPTTAIATLKTHIRSMEELLSPNNVKVVCKENGDALYFSRQAIPYCRGEEESSWLHKSEYFKHVGIYAFRAEVLEKVCRLPQSMLECSENLEQLRWLEAGYSIAVRETSCANIGIDTPADLEQAERELKSEK